MSLRLEDAPNVATAAATTPAQNSAAPLGQSNYGDLCCSKEIRVLIVDDDESTGKVIEAALQGFGFNIRRVSDPTLVHDALHTAVDEGYHLLLLDYVLPGLEAESVLEWVRDLQPDASVIVVTGYPSVDSALNCLRARTFDYITKPFQVTQLRQIVLRCLEAKGLLRMSEEALRETLGATIREKRKAQGMTLAQMSARAEVSLGYLSQIELGKNSASIETLYRICLALGMKLSDLFAVVQRGN